MDLRYIDANEQTIQATLYDGEHLGNHIGPAVIFVPTDPANAEYAEILAEGYPIAPYEPPPDPGPQPLTLEAHPEGDFDATTKLSVETYVQGVLEPIQRRLASLEAKAAH